MPPIYSVSGRTDTCPVCTEEVTIMTIILSLYSSILALAIWQDRHGRDDSDCAGKGC
jgi:hypothetical protein